MKYPVCTSCKHYNAYTNACTRIIPCENGQLFEKNTNNVTIDYHRYATLIDGGERAKGKTVSPCELKETIVYRRNGMITYRTSNIPPIEKVVFNEPATVILWKDGTKTVVKCQEGDTYNKETGFALAYLKRILGNDNTFNKEIAKWVPKETVDELTLLSLSYGVNDAEKATMDARISIKEAIANLYKEFGIKSSEEEQ